MACEAIICDWNGTITCDRDERPILSSIAVHIFKASIPCHPFRMAHILRARRELEALYRHKRQDADFDFVTEMFHIYNERILRGVPVAWIRRSVDDYAGRQETQEKLDRRILRPIDRRHRDGTTTGILSAGYRDGIQRVLKSVGYEHSFDFYQANLLEEESGKAIRLELDIYKNKSQLLLKLLRERDLDERDVVYVGDSDGDAGCFEIVGHPVVAFLTPEELKEWFAAKYDAFVPKDEAELAGYLSSL